MIINIKDIISLLILIFIPLSNEIIASDDTFNNSNLDSLKRANQNSAFADKYLSDASIDRADIPENTILLNEIHLSQDVSNIYSNDSDNNGWIELYNYGDYPVDLNGFYLTDDANLPKKWCLNVDNSTNYILKPGGYLILYIFNAYLNQINHINFSPSPKGGIIYLFNKDLVLIDRLIYKQQLSNYSYGRCSENIHKLNYFITPSPLNKNIHEGIVTTAPMPDFSIPSGNYHGPLSVEIKTIIPGYSIYYTLDGSEPTENSTYYDQAIYITNSTVIRAIAYKSGSLPSEISSHTYLINQSSTIKTISIIIDPNDLNGVSGLFTNPLSGLEKLIHVELFENDGKIAFDVNCGLQLHSPKGNKQYSLNLYARSEYGTSEMDYPFFKNFNVISFKRLVLRNAGNDCNQGIKGRVHFRDPLTEILAKKINSSNEISAYEPVNLFINGQYFGLYNMREKEDRFYIKSHHGSENVDILERTFGEPENKKAIEGDWLAYDSLIDYIKSHDLSDSTTYNVIETKIDIQNFMDYWIHEVYVGNLDWLSNNIKFYRIIDGDQKWRWIFWDLDYGFGLPYPIYSKPQWNTLEWSTSTDDERQWGGENNIIIRNLLLNQEFRNRFINRFCDLLNSYYNPDYVLHIADSIKRIIAPEIQKQINRWGGNITDWSDGCDSLEEYIIARPSFVWDHIKDKFNLPTPTKVHIQIYPEGAGIITINSIQIKSSEMER